jgi:prepilin-type N-terminal cleavage/methylation domain-containing protein
MTLRGSTPRSVPSQRGFSLIEVLIAISVLAFGLLALSSAGGSGLSQLTRSREDMQYAADIQQEIDSLLARGWNNVTSDSALIRGRRVRWTVTTAGSNSQLVTIVADRRRYTNRTQIVRDTIILYLAKSTPGS